jgi:hypothetical protein
VGAGLVDRDLHVAPDALQHLVGSTVTFPAVRTDAE